MLLLLLLLLLLPLTPDSHQAFPPFIFYPQTANDEASQPQTNQMSAPPRFASGGPSPSPKALEWCKKIQVIQQERMTPEQRQHVLQAAERQREILQCQVVSSEVQTRMKNVQVQPLARISLHILRSCFLTQCRSLPPAKRAVHFPPPPPRRGCTSSHRLR